MAELLAANQITIAKVLDGEKGEMSAEQIAQLNQASSDASEAKTDASTAKDSVDTLSDKTRSGYIETLSGSGFVQSTKTEDGGTAEVIVYGKSVQDGTPWIGTEVDSAPYLNRAMPSQSNDYNRESLKIVGGTVAWNQLASSVNAASEVLGITRTEVDGGKGLKYTGTSQSSTNFTATVISKNKMIEGHKYLVSLGDVSLPTGVRLSVASNDKQTSTISLLTSRTLGVIINSGVQVDFTVYPNIFDLTQMFGSTIADYIYSLEQSQAGAGVAWFKKLFPNDYYAYNAGELLSVEGLSAHVMRDANNNVIGNYPLDSSLTLRGIPKLDASNNLYYDGDEYTSDGKVKRRIRTITFNGSEDWVASSNANTYYLTLNSTTFPYRFASDVTASSFSEFSYKGTGTTSAGIADKQFYLFVGGSSTIREIAFKDSACANLSAWKAKLQANPITVIYETNPTTETATPYTNPQIVDPDGIEEFVSTGILPVGHNSTYLLVCPISVCDNVSVSVKGKNLFDINKIVPNNMSVENGELHLANASGGNDNIQNGQKLSDLANLEVGETYTLSANSTYSNKVIYLNTSAKDWAFGTSTVITQEDLDSRIGWYGNGAIISNIQIELGSTVTDYEPYQAKTATLSDIVLRSTPDGTRDRLFKDTDGLWKVERNCAYISSYNGESITTSYYSNTGELSTGASVVYALEVPTYETLSDSIQAELNALTTYNPVTNVIASDGVTPDIDVSFWTRDYYAKNAAENAAKVATNFMEYDGTNGLVIGNKTSGSWSGYRSQILPGSFNVLDAYSTVLASFGPTTVIGEEANANLHLTFNNLSMVDKDGTTLFEVGDNRNAEGIATIKHTAIVVANSTGSATVTVNSNISSIVSVYADSVQLSSSSYSFSQKDVTINNLTANSQTSIEITYTTTESTVYLTFGERDSSGNIGSYSVAEGYATTASGYCSHAEGYRTNASAQASHAEGGYTTASEAYSHAEGQKTTASGWYSHAEGHYSKANEWASHAEGQNTTASAMYSHAEGENTIASAIGTHAGGRFTVADGNYMTAIGTYNTENSGKAFVVGNGTSDKARSDAFAVDWSGNTVTKGGLTLGTPLSIANGGTGATTAAAARSNLGITKLTNAIKTRLPSNKSLTNNYSKCSLAQAMINGSLFTLSNDEITCGESGIVEVNLTLYCYNGFTANDLVGLACYKNGSLATRVVCRVNMAGAYEMFNKTDYINVSEGDKLSLYAYNGGGNRGVIADETQMLVRYIA